jgi:hypothetical protein
VPHVALVPFTGFQIREREMLELGMALPGLRARWGDCAVACAGAADTRQAELSSVDVQLS